MWFAFTRKPTACGQLILLSARRGVWVGEGESSSTKGSAERQCVTCRLGQATYDAAIQKTYSWTACCAAVTVQTSKLWGLQMCLSLHFVLRARNQWWILHEHTCTLTLTTVNIKIHSAQFQVSFVCTASTCCGSPSAMTDQERDSRVPITDKCAVDWKECHIQTEMKGRWKVYAPTETKEGINRTSCDCFCGATTWSEGPLLPA